MKRKQSRPIKTPMIILFLSMQIIDEYLSDVRTSLDGVDSSADKAVLQTFIQLMISLSSQNDKSLQESFDDSFKCKHSDRIKAHDCK